jgi:hypothetical protein
MEIKFIVLGEAKDVPRSEALWPIYCDDTGFPFAYAPNKEAQKFIAEALHQRRLVFGPKEAGALTDEL